MFTVLSATQLVGGFDNVRDGRIVFVFGSFDVRFDRTSLRLANFVAAADPAGVPAPPAAVLLPGGVLAMPGVRQVRRRVEREGGCNTRLA